MFFCKLFLFLHGSICFSWMYLGVVVIYFTWLSMKPFNMYVQLRKNVLRCVSLSSSLSVRNFYSSNSFSIHQSNHIIFLLLYHFSSLFILGKHFIFILHLADLLFLSFTFSLNSLLIPKWVLILVLPF